MWLGGARQGYWQPWMPCLEIPLAPIFPHLTCAFVWLPLLPEPPKVLHYGLLWQVPGTQYSFDKHWHYQFDPLSCPPWDVG